MTLHKLSFPLIMIGLGIWQFWRAGRLARTRAEIETASAEQRRIYEAHGYPSIDPGKVRLMGAALLVIGLVSIVTLSA